MNLPHPPVCMDLRAAVLDKRDPVGDLAAEVQDVVEVAAVVLTVTR